MPRPRSRRALMVQAARAVALFAMPLHADVVEMMIEAAGGCRNPCGTCLYVVLDGGVGGDWCRL